MKRIQRFQVMQDIYSYLRSRKSFSYIANDIKNKYDYKTLSEYLPKLFKTNKRVVSGLWGNLFPNTLHKLSSSPISFYQPKDTWKEMDWIKLQISKNRDTIRSFVKCRDQINTNILLGDYEIAIRKLEECKNSFGYSVWYYEMLILVYCLSGEESKAYGLQKEIIEYSRISNQGRERKILPLLIHLLHFRSSESKVACFEDELENFTKRNIATTQIDILNYIKYRLDYYSVLDNVDYKSILHFEESFSLIDRYISLISVLSSIFLKDGVKRLEASDYANHLYKITLDPLLFPLIAYNTKLVLSDVYFDQNYSKIVDDYYSKNYDNVMKACKDYVKRNPSSLNNVKLYIQSLINSNKDYSPINPNNDCLINVISKYIYAILTDQDSHKSLEALTNLNMRLFGLPLSAALHSFIGEQNFNKKRPFQAYELCTSFDPIYTRIWEIEQKSTGFLSRFVRRNKTRNNLHHISTSNRNALAYLDKGINHGLEGIAIHYYQSYFSPNFSCPEGIAQYRIKRDKARYYFKIGEYLKCITACQVLLDLYPDSISICQEATEYTFRSFDALEKYSDAISFYVDQYIKRESFTYKINHNDFVAKLRANSYENLLIDIDLLVFIFLNCETDDQKANILDIFMSYFDLNNLNDFIDVLEEQYDPKKIELFLSLLLQSDVLKYMTFTQSTLHLFQEKLYIANYLKDLHSSQFDLYSSLYEEYEKRIMLLYNRQNLNQCKIYVDLDFLVNKELISFEKYYVQLKEIYNIASTLGEIKIVDLHNNSNYFSKSEVDGNRFNTTNNPYSDVAILLFDNIRDKFLFGQLGLSTFISARIRHGILDGILESVFDKHHLELKTEKNEYVPIDYWKNKYELDSDLQNRLMSVFTYFSKDLINIIVEFKEDILQIRADDDGKGLFDYRASPNLKCTYVFQALFSTNNYRDFCYALLAEFDIITTPALDKIRKYVKSKLNNKLFNLTNSLEIKSLQFKSDYFYQELLSEINTSRAELKNALVQIESWFALRSTNIKDFYLSDLMYSLWNVTAMMYPNIHLNCLFKTDDAKVIIKSRYYYFISDILTIFYNNIYKHGKTLPDNLVIISANISDGVLSLHFENSTRLPDEKVNAKLKECLNSKCFQIENGSGLAKVKNIIIHEFNGQISDIKAEASDGICHIDLAFQLNPLKADYEYLVN